MTDEHSSNSILPHICRTCTLAHHLSLGSSIVRASQRSSEGCGFDPHLGLRNRFMRTELGELSSIILRYLQAPTFPKHISQ